MATRRGFWWAAAASAVLTLAFLLWMALDWGGKDATKALDDLGELVVALGAAGVCWLAARAMPARSRRRWWLMGVSAFAWGAGEAVWSYYELVAHRDVPFPSLADVGYLAAVPLAAVALLTYDTGLRSATSRTRAILDAGI